MASVPFVIERRLQYHGIWNAGYNIGELFFKSISKDFATKPAYPSVLKLSINSLNLTVYQRSTSHPREIRTDTIPFGALRDIAVNAFNHRCLMMIYVNNKNKFSVLVTSCRDAKETTDIAIAFKSLSAIAQARKLQVQQQSNPNWIMRKNVSSNSPSSTPTTTNNNVSTEEQTVSVIITNQIDGRKILSDNHDNDVVHGSKMASIRGAPLGPVDDPETNGLPSTAPDSDVSSIKSRTESSVLAENFDFLKEHEAYLDEDSVFGEAVTCDREEGPGNNSFSVSLQVDVPDRSDRISISSETSFLSFQSVKDEMDSITPSSTISEEEYSKRMFEVPVNGVQNGEERDSGHAGSSLVNGCQGDEIKCHVVIVDKTDDFDFRGVGIQTEGLARTRYTKKSSTAAGSPNVYRAMATQRKLKQNAQDSPRPTRSVPLQNVSRTRPSSHYITNDVRGGAVPPRPMNLSASMRTPGGTKSSVSRPIEEVYQRSHTWSRRGTAAQQRRRVLVVHSGRNSLRI